MINAPHTHYLACHECDLLQLEIELTPGSIARCCRCGAVLFRNSPNALERALALTVGAALLFIISNAFPVMGLKVNGDVVQATLIGTVVVLYRDGMWLIAALVAFTTVLTPLLEIMAMLYLLLPLQLQRVTYEPSAIFRTLLQVRAWRMIEVFVIGVLVALVKLEHLAEIIPGIALWSFAALMLLLTAASAAFDPRALWARFEATR
ncbi:MAG TPA: paraquat-inducible protein A [Spongiibacteraceae bacterium]|nr:paraquat-inducible protein A [Spongiibacteraceae bacterium]